MILSLFVDRTDIVVIHCLGDLASWTKRRFFFDFRVTFSSGWTFFGRVTFSHFSFVRRISPIKNSVFVVTVAIDLLQSPAKSTFELYHETLLVRCEDDWRQGVTLGYVDGLDGYDCRRDMFFCNAVHSR